MAVGCEILFTILVHLAPGWYWNFIKGPWTGRTSINPVGRYYGEKVVSTTARGT